jgi:hypothetical protein
MVLQPPDQFSFTVLLFAATLPELPTASLCKSLINLWILCFLFCALTQLCNVNQQMHTFEINVLIQLTASSTCFEHHVFIIRKTIFTCSFAWYVFHTFM